MESKPAPAGEMKVVLGPGWPAILIHEAVGHGLEGDFNRKKTSAFHDLMGQKVASEGVTIVDDGTIDNRRGSLTIIIYRMTTGKVYVKKLSELLQLTWTVNPHQPAK